MTRFAEKLPETESESSDARGDLVDLIFDGKFSSLHQDLRAALENPLFDQRPGLSTLEAGRLSYERARFLHEHLELGSELPHDQERMFAVSEWSCLVDITTLPVLNIHYNLCMGTILQHGAGRDDLGDYLDELRSMSSIGLLIATELGYGNNIAALETEAVYDHETGEFVLNTPNARAQKFMPNTGISDIPKLAVVLARLKVSGADRGVFPFIVRISDRNGLRPGVHVTRLPEKPGFALDNGVTRFDHVRIPRRNLLTGSAGRLTDAGEFRANVKNRRTQVLRALDRVTPGRICLSGALISAARASTYIAVRYAWQRLTAAPGRGEVPIISFRSQQSALFTSLARVYAMTFLLNHVKKEYLHRHGGDDTEVNQLVSIAKALSSWEMSEVLHVCRERCGAQGMFSINRIADYLPMAQGVVTAEGDNLPLLATVAGQMVAGRSGRVASAPQVPEPGDIRDGQFHLDLLRYREDSLRWETRQAMRKRSDERPSLASGWNDNMNAAVSMARTRGVQVALERFLDAADRARTEESRTALQLLACLYGLIEVERDSGWYLARNALTPEQVERLPREIDSLCEQILPHSLMLVDAFGVSPELLRAPIAADDYVSAVDQAVGHALTSVRPNAPAPRQPVEATAGHTGNGRSVRVEASTG
ncbi:acyl-coenzyme A oxidase [Saccharopolyspora erythraea NRRL 2338]|uniref:Acyl-CoA oxidase n=2 Tax=Saccharopolyspora erythraea TaxID=1836 RepID=A4FKZ8_SACEN|nr:acyl-CoA dehydrogenase [Saccharopolyspora erythraea]PFG98362.1 acyl-coenzyme A oxidase [Saccharopolyspora erythraea NRRL 2338]QRK88434.1 acyl-CoA oxidase [Saccharopolyspora erythraea]CAM04723.1 acyl-CoA oxidase [Saccharopolyspora erythraea NRRL 2338]